MLATFFSQLQNPVVYCNDLDYSFQVVYDFGDSSTHALRRLYA